MDETTQGISPNGTDIKCSSDDSKNAGNTTPSPISGHHELCGDTELQQKENDDQLKSEPLALNSRCKDINFAATIDDSINTEDRSGGFKDDEMFSATNTSQKCEPCLYDNINENVQSFCVVCVEYLCKTCTRDHRKSKTTRSHKVLDGKELPASADVFKKMKETMTCVDHTESEVSYKCEVHDLYICTDCIAVKHRKCEKVTEVSKVIAVSDERRDAVFQTLKSINESTSSIRASKENNIKSLRQSAVDVAIRRQEHIQSIQTHLEKLNRQSANETEIHLAQELEKLNKDVEKCKDIETEEKQHEELLHVASNHGSIREQNVLYEKITKQADILRKKSKNLDVKSNTTLQFLKDTKIQEITSIGRVLIKKDNEDGKVFHDSSLQSSSDALYEKEEKAILAAKEAEETDTPSSKIKDDKETEKSNHGPLIREKPLNEKAEKAIFAAKETDTPSSKLKDDKNTEISKHGPLIQEKPLNEKAEKALFAAKETDTPSSKTKDDKKTEISKRVPLIKGKLKKMRTMYDIKMDDDESICSVSAIVLLANGQFVISDKANMNIKFLDADFSVSSSYQFDDEPIDMCEVSPGYLSVIFNNVKGIKKYRLCESYVMSSSFYPTKYYPIGISKSNNGVLILFSDEPKDNPKTSDKDVIELQIRNINEITMQTSTFKNSKSIEVVLENPNRVISLGSDPEMFLIAEEKKIHCFKKDGADMTEMWFFRSYRDNILEGASDVAMDSERNVYVCGEDSRNVHQLSLDNYRNNRVLMSVPASPTSLCVDSSRRIIVVGCKNDDFLYVAYFQ